MLINPEGGYMTLYELPPASFTACVADAGVFDDDVESMPVIDLAVSGSICEAF